MNSTEFKKLKSYKQKLVSVKDTYPDIFKALINLRDHTVISNLNETIQRANAIVSKAHNSSMSLSLQTSFDTLDTDDKQIAIMKRTASKYITPKIVDRTERHGKYVKFVAPSNQVVYLYDITPDEVQDCLSHFLTSPYWSTPENDTAWLKANHIPQSHVL